MNENSEKLLLSFANWIWHWKGGGCGKKGGGGGKEEEREEDKARNGKRRTKGVERKELTERRL